MQSVTGSARPSELGNKQVQLVQELLQKGGATRVERPDRTTSSRQSRLRAAFQQLKRDTTLLLKREVNTANKACRFDSKFEYKSGVSILAQAARGKPFGVSRGINVRWSSLQTMPLPLPSTMPKSAGASPSPSTAG
eukprot:scaffold54223_cov21-Tisochrysis_lutea.AAC.1